jgi:hypothetical protein
MAFAKGDFALMNGKLCVIVGVWGDPGVPEEHLAAWYGAEADSAIPEVRTIPAEYFVRPDSPVIFRH